MAAVNKVLPLVALLALAQQASAAAVQDLTQNGQCLQVSGTPSNGAAVTFAECNGNNGNSEIVTGQQWIIAAGNNAGVQLYGSNFCLDGQADTPGQEAVVFPCIGNTAQTWYLTGDNRVAITGGSQCLTSNDNGAETQDCAPGITSQAWIPTLLFDTETISSSAVGVGGAGGTASATASSAASSIASSASASASSAATGVSASASSAASSASSSASSAASGASSAAASAATSASSAVSAATGTAASAASSVASGATSVASAGTSAVASGGSSIVSAATSGVESIGSAAGSGLSSVAGAATSAVGGGTGGAVDLKHLTAGFWVAVSIAMGVAIVA